MIIEYTIIQDQVFCHIVTVLSVMQTGIHKNISYTIMITSSYKLIGYG